MITQSTVLGRRKPSKFLTPYVKEYYLVEVAVDIQEVKEIFSPAALRSMLVINYGPDFGLKFDKKSNKVSSHMSLAGFTTKPFNIIAKGSRIQLFFVELTAVGASSLLREKGTSFINDNLDFNDFIPPKKRRLLRETLSETSKLDDMVKHVESFLFQFVPCYKHIYRLRTVLNALRLIESSDSMSIDRISNELKFSQRHLLRMFDEHVGLSPKKYIRLQRFSKTFKQIIHKKKILNHSYYDQSHMVREFSKFTGFTPKKFPKEIITREHILECIPHLDIGRPNMYS